MVQFPGSTIVRGRRGGPDLRYLEGMEGDGDGHRDHGAIADGCGRVVFKSMSTERTYRRIDSTFSAIPPMRNVPSDVAFTPAVKAVQEWKGSRKSYARMEQGAGWQTTVTPELADFIADLDMFFLGTANAEGQPYIQYRGGLPGFLRVIDDHTLGFADFGGNRQYITLGNLAENTKVFLFLMDYANSGG